LNPTGESSDLPFDPAPVSKRTSLTLTAHAVRPLSKAQKTFNRLVAEIEGLRRNLQGSTQAWSRALEQYSTRIYPQEQRLHGLRKQLIRLLVPFWRKGKPLGRKQRLALRSIIAKQLDIVVFQDGPALEADLAEVFQELEGTDLKTTLNEDFEESRSSLEQELAEMGLHFDLSGFTADMKPEEMAAELARLTAKHQEEHGSKAEAQAEKPRRKPSKREQAREAKLKAAEELQQKDLGQIYRNLAKLLHPDLEPDPARRQEKEAVMKRLTLAYHNRDLHALLQLELEWIHGEGADASRLSDEKLRLYNQVLTEQVEQLRQELSRALSHPRYEPVRSYLGLFDSVLDFDAESIGEELQFEVERTEACIRNLSGEQALDEVREMLKWTMQNG
jgi:hypothetical protein